MTVHAPARAIVAIPSINGGRLLERMLPSLRINPRSVVVLDQGSTDDTARVCEMAGVELMQLGQPHTYTQACNIGARLARQRGYPFLCVANNDIVLRTDVVSELLAEMDRDPRLGVIAPSQVILDPTSNVDVLARRVSWNLDTVAFLHDLDPAPAPPRLEADFCEFTFALIRMEAVQEIGFLDDAYGFYYEDADFGFRLRKAGYSAAYLPRTQIYHLTSSTFSRKRQEQVDYLRRNRMYFASKHLGYGVGQAAEDGALGGPWDGQAGVVLRQLYPELRRFGLIDDSRPSLMAGRIGPMTSDYLLLPRGAEKAPSNAGRQDQYRGVLAPSEAAAGALRAAGFAGFYVPAGIDPEIFHPWGRERQQDETVYLALPNLFERGSLHGLFRAWMQFGTQSGARRARLVVAGTRLWGMMGRAADTAYRTGRTEVSWYAVERIELRQTEGAPDQRDLAGLYRSADFTVVIPGTDAGLRLAETLACGTPAVFDPADPDLAALYRDVTGRNGPTPPTSSGTGDGLLAALRHSERLSARDYAALAESGRYEVLGHSTLRHAAMAVRHALEMTQERERGRVLRRLEQTALGSDDASAALPASGQPAPTLRERLSGGVARRLTMAGTKTVRFGEIWQRGGLRAAVSRTAVHLRPAPRPDDPVVPDVSRPASAVVPKAATPLLIGYIDAQLGIGQSLRGLAMAMAEAGASFSVYPFGVGVEGRRSVPIMQERYDETTPHDINIIEVSPAELPRVFGHISADHFSGSYNILRTYWELAKGPAAWRHDHGMERIDEIWAPNEFCATAFRDFFDGPILIVPPCLDVADLALGAGQAGKERFGLDPGTFHFMFSFDYFSFPERKNPLAAVRSFLAAFADRAHPVGLVVKATSAAGHFPNVKKEILAAAEADGRITVIDASLPREDMLALMAAIDCYVSLHRSEGFGLGMAEAMAMGKPVIATAYSGNSEFVTDQTGYPIPYTLTPVRQHEYVHTEGQMWADPDEDACTAAMRDVVEQPAVAAERARAGRAFVTERYGHANVGRIATDRLAEISRARAGAQTAAKPQSDATIRERASP